MKKRYVSLAIVLTCTLILTGCSTKKDEDKASKKETGATEKKLTILGTSDIHGRYMPWDYATDVANTDGSFAQISTIVNEVRKEDPNMLLVDAGDLIQDNSAELFQKDDPHPATESLKALKYDIWTMGNHEFDYGFDVLDNITKQFDGAVLAGNVQLEDDTPYFAPYKIIERDGVKVGFIGMTTPMVAEFKEDTDIFDGKKLTDPVKETIKTIKEIKEKADILVAVVHMGIENENNVENTGVADMAKQIPELDVIFAGHMHTLVEEEFINDVLIVEPDKYGRYVSRVDLTLEKDKDGFKTKEKKGSAIKVADYEEDKKITQLLADSHEKARKDANTELGKLIGMDLVPENEIKGIPQVQIQETPLHNFLGEVMQHYSQDADVVAFQIDTDSPKLNVGDIRKKDIAKNYRYAGGEVTVYDVTGKDLKDYMEWAAGYYNTLEDGDVTISFDKERRTSKYNTNDRFHGIKYDIDLREPAKKRIKNLTKLDGTPIKDDTSIKVGMNAYRMKFLQSEDGPLVGRDFKEIYSTTDEENFGEVDGRIQQLCARYLDEVVNRTYEGKMLHNWDVIGLDKNQEGRDAVVKLMNEGIISLPSSDDGVVTNIESINIKKKPTSDDIKAIADKAKLNPDDFKSCETTGELYTKVAEALKK